jgi:glycosyltransferase involved in cell wall biosynthesis
VTSLAINRVVFLTPVLHNGGAERVLGDIANGLVNHDCEVEIISLAYEADIAHLDPNISVRFLHDATESAQRGGTIFEKISRRWRLLRRLRQALKGIAPGATVIGFLEPSAQYLWLIRLVGGPRYLVSLHAYESTYFAEFYQNRLRRVIEEKLLSLACHQADCITVPSEGCRRDLIMHFGVLPGKIHAIQNPVNLNAIRKLAREFPEGPQVPRGTTLFVQAARLVKQKNHQLLIQACEILRRSHENFVVWCCGEGPERPAIETLIAKAGLENHVRLLGYFSNPYALMAEARGLLLTSEYESFGLVLVEAMICGAPPIATDCRSGPDEVLSEGAGLLVPRNAPDAFAGAMLTLIQDDVLHANLRERGRIKAEQYSIENTIRLWMSLLAEVRPDKRA